MIEMIEIGAGWWMVMSQGHGFAHAAEGLVAWGAWAGVFLAQRGRPWAPPSGSLG